jgi:uncharacterized protein YqgC (DUF456 family)
MTSKSSEGISRTAADAAADVIATKVERGAASLGQKVSGAGLAVAWGALGEAAGQVLGLFVNISPNGLGHAGGTILASICAIYLSRGKPITLKDCLRKLAGLRDEKLITKDEYLERRANCLRNHHY